MREIIFRGKIDTDDYIEPKGTWVYGGLYFVDGEPFIGNDYDDYCVDSETVGQYTGLKDDDDEGTQIFEGDILELTYLPPLWLEEKKVTIHAYVEFGNPNGALSWGFQLVFLDSDTITSGEFVPNILLWVETELPNTTCKVIGNIHDTQLRGNEWKTKT